MLRETYKDIKTVNFEPTQDDIEEYRKMLDYNKDGQITIQLFSI